jgi:hypothetical protein
MCLIAPLSLDVLSSSLLLEMCGGGECGTIIDAASCGAGGSFEVDDDTIRLVSIEDETAPLSCEAGGVKVDGTNTKPAILATREL